MKSPQSMKPLYDVVGPMHYVPERGQSKQPIKTDLKLKKTQEIVTPSKWAFSRLSDDVQVVIFHTYMYRWEIIIHEEYDKNMPTV